ncbi:hypothetical protein DBV15_07274 [Temnothorax longispinosus]|uniref:Uncharacterized protein n=1 Tax=Temnothorax longispinosus TaxID=300112 RepID=A0A4S2JK99_9HYME|nr:hypothetical protein DBV15_07274 [Temnothorax longispinosus]
MSISAEIMTAKIVAAKSTAKVTAAETAAETAVVVTLNEHGISLFDDYRYLDRIGHWFRHFDGDLDWYLDWIGDLHGHLHGVCFDNGFKRNDIFNFGTFNDFEIGTWKFASQNLPSRLFIFVRKTGYRLEMRDCAYNRLLQTRTKCGSYFYKRFERLSYWSYSLLACRCCSCWSAVSTLVPSWSTLAFIGDATVCPLGNSSVPMKLSAGRKLGGKEDNAVSYAATFVAKKKIAVGTNREIKENDLKTLAATVVALIRSCWNSLTRSDKILAYRKWFFAVKRRNLVSLNTAERVATVAYKCALSAPVDSRALRDGSAGGRRRQWDFRVVCISASPTASVTLCNNGKGFGVDQTAALMNIWIDVLAQDRSVYVLLLEIR